MSDFLFLAHQRLYFNTCHKVHFGNWSGLKENESSSSHKHLDNCLLQHEKQLEVSGSWEKGESAGAVGQWFVWSIEERVKGQRWGGKLCFEVTREVKEWGQTGLEGGKWGKPRKPSAREKAIVGLLGDHKSNKNHNTMIFPEKCSLEK